MTESTPYTLGDYFGVVRRRWIYPATILPVAILIAVYLAYTAPPIYRSSGTILLEDASIPADLVRTTVTTRIDVAQRIVLTQENMAALIESVDPYSDSDLSADAKAQELLRNVSVQRVDPVTLQPVEVSNAFSVSFYHASPDVARTVAGRLVEMFLNYGRETRAQGAADTHGFLLAQSRHVLEEIAELESRLADFRTQYTDAMPDAQARNQQSLERLVRELDTVEQQIRTAEERRRLFELQLTQINPYLFDPDGDWQAELASLRAQLAEARQRYTEEHPTVRRLRRSIDAMSARAEATAASDRTAPADNPNYIQVASQLETVTAELAALRTTASRARQQIQAYEDSLVIAPEVERQYRQLARDYDTAQARHREIESALREASLAQALETEERGERLTLLRAPSRPSTPDSPNRLGIILLGFVLGSALGGGLAAFTESSDPTIRSARDLTDITDIKPLGAVPVILNGEDRRKRALAWMAATVVLVAAVMFVGATVAQAAPWPH
jgi:polysaccharide biosynthesis transport protein